MLVNACFQRFGLHMFSGVKVCRTIVRTELRNTAIHNNNCTRHISRAPQEQYHRGKTIVAMSFL